jgi:hypothetical protein
MLIEVPGDDLEFALATEYGVRRDARRPVLRFADRETPPCARDCRAGYRIERAAGNPAARLVQGRRWRRAFRRVPWPGDAAWRPCATG